MIFDCIFYNGERDILEARADHLDGIVDRHVVVHGTHTFTGMCRNVDCPSIPGVHHHIVDLSRHEGATAWSREWHQRGECLAALMDAGAKPGDWILVSDVDEFPRVEVLKAERLVALELQSLVYCLNGWQKDGVGLCSVYVPFGMLERLGTRLVRDERYRVEALGGAVAHDAGWHFTYQGGAEAVRRKLRAFSHQEFNRADLMGAGEIERRIEAGLWLGQEWGDEPIIEYRDLDSFAPPAIKALAERCPQMLKEVAVHG